MKKHGFYVRFMDDWIVIGRDRAELEEVAMRCRSFLCDALRLDAPDRKTSLVPVTHGIDWLGFVLFPYHRVLRPVTMRRMRRRPYCRTETSNRLEFH